MAAHGRYSQEMDHIEKPHEGRVESVDAFRGFTMFMLIAQGFGLRRLGDYPFWGVLARQFDHPWSGIHYWDIIEPSFMFIVGVVIPFAITRRLARGESRGQVLRHVITRSIILFLLGNATYCTGAGHLVWAPWSVLNLIAVSYLISYLLMDTSVKVQAAVCAVLIIGTDIAYRGYGMAVGADPFVIDHNLGSYVDLLLIGRLYENGDGWVFLDCVPSTAFTLCGVMAGTLLKSDRTPAEKMKILLTAGLPLIVLGYALSPIDPMIKRICTASYMVAACGYCIVIMAFFYWLVDVKGQGRWLKFMTIVGMNSIFIYMTMQIAGGFIDKTVAAFTMDILRPLEVTGLIIHDNVVIFVQWYLCYWLYRNKIFFRI